MGILTPFFVTHVRIIASGKSTAASAHGFCPFHYALLPLRHKAKPANSVLHLLPIIFGAEPLE